MSARAVIVAGTCVASIAAFGCRTPTQITVEVRTDLVCEADRPETSITVGALGAIEDKAPVTVSTRCENHRVGAIVVVPSGANDDALALRVVTGIGKSAEQCVFDHYTGGCIVARRALRFVPHESLDLPIEMLFSCKDVPCGALFTCVNGACVPATITDPSACHGEGCSLEAQFPAADAGVPDAGPAPAPMR
jgi:hypothetical protein